MALKGNIQISRDILSPVEQNGKLLPLPNRVRGDFTIKASDWNDLLVKVSITHFAITSQTDNICNCRSLNTSFLFQILRENMFNIKEPNRRICEGSWVYYGDCSYIQSVKWENFVRNSSIYIDKAIELRDRKNEFNITKKI